MLQPVIWLYRDYDYDVTVVSLKRLSSSESRFGAPGFTGLGFGSSVRASENLSEALRPRVRGRRHR